MAEIRNELLKIPPVTRFLLGATFAVSIPIMAKVVPPYPLLFEWKLVSESFQIWRVFTSFFLASSGINFVFDIAMLYRNSNALEEGYYARRSADYAYHLLVAGASIIALNIPLRSPVHFRPLFIAITTLVSLLNPEAQTSLFGLVTFPQKFFPLAILAMDFVQGGPHAAATAITGLITGYAFWILEWKETPGSPPPGSGRLLGRAPAWLQRLIGDQSIDPVPPVAGGVNVQAPAGRSLNDGGRGVSHASNATATTTGYNWGTGHRLGSN